jgi:putative transposase
VANRNTVRKFRPNASFHVYNRGVAKQPVFLDVQDYRAFIRRLQLIFLPPKEAEKIQHTESRVRVANSFGQVWLQAFCLMPNHFHMLLSQGDNAAAITAAMRTLSTSYSMYFNSKYDRVGSVFQGKYKAALVDNDTYHLHLSRYIHCNPRTLTDDIFSYPYSSLQYYFSDSRPQWITSEDIEKHFSNATEHQNFVNDLKDIQSAAEHYDI